MPRWNKIEFTAYPKNSDTISVLPLSVIEFFVACCVDAMTAAAVGATHAVAARRGRGPRAGECEQNDDAGRVEQIV
jgi:hypothetical protein